MDFPDSSQCKKKLKAKERTEVPIEEEHASEDFTDQITEDVRKAFFILSEEEQFIVALSVFAGYNSTEIGKMYKLNASTVRSKRKRALEKMKILFM